jgi:two-component system, chemotaxis family, chemotaxis protein CheY
MSFRVLIVDDSPVMRTFIRRIIVPSGMEGAEFLEASDGAEALDLLRAQWVDVVLTDINMPSMDGEELLRRLEADAVLKTVPVVVVSTDGTASRIRQMLSLGAPTERRGCSRCVRPAHEPWRRTRPPAWSSACPGRLSVPVRPPASCRCPESRRPSCPPSCPERSFS